MKRHIVTLVIELKDDEEPGWWNWDSLLDLGIGERVSKANSMELSEDD